MLIEIKNLSKTYITGKIEFKALDDITTNIDEGEFSAIIGPSGSGKTTLLNCIGCIDKGETGQILFNQQDLMLQNSNQLAQIRKQHFGFIFQTYNLIPVLTVFENIELPLKLLKISEEEIQQRVTTIIKKVNLTGLEKRKPLELSGGQQQRVSIARALIKKPRLILADEPTANLDSKTGESIIALMQQLNKNEGVTFLFSTHDKLVMKHARRLIEVTDGKITKDSKKKKTVIKKKSVKKKVAKRLLRGKK